MTTYAYTTTNGRMTQPPPAKIPTVRWRKKGCRNCQPIVVPTRALTAPASPVSRGAAAMGANNQPNPQP